MSKSTSPTRDTIVSITNAERWYSIETEKGREYKIPISAARAGIELKTGDQVQVDRSGAQGKVRLAVFSEDQQTASFAVI